MGLSLREMKRVLDLARNGQSPCPEVERLVEQKLEMLVRQIPSLRELQRRLRCICEDREKTQARKDRSKELCCLIAGLPEARLFQNNNRYAKN